MQTLMVGLLVVLAFAPAHAVTLRVANNGQNVAGCGQAGATPCRSITRAIANASDGDTILVGPGKYGDLNGSGVLGGVGEEIGNVDGCNCVVNVNKRVRLRSTAGADATTIDGRGLGLVGVAVSADEAVFGAKGKGFSVLGGGVGIGGNQATVEGNVIDGGFDSVSVGGFDDVVRGNRIVNAVAVGVFLGGLRTQLLGNVITHNNEAIEIQYEPESSDSSHSIRGNYIVGNDSGLTMNGYNDVVTGNAILGNAGLGVTIDGSGSFCRNNIYGNDEALTEAPCLVGTGFRNTGTSVSARDNFWGAAGGPGPNPADQVCDDGGTTTVVPFAASERPVTTKQITCP